MYNLESRGCRQWIDESAKAQNQIKDGRERSTANEVACLTVKLHDTGWEAMGSESCRIRQTSA